MSKPFSVRGWSECNWSILGRMAVEFCEFKKLFNNCWVDSLTSMLPSYSWWTCCLFALKRSVSALWARTGRIQQPTKAYRWSDSQLTRRSGSGHQALQSASMSFVLASYYEYYKESMHLLVSCSSSLRHTETTYKYEDIILQQQCSFATNLHEQHWLWIFSRTKVLDMRQDALRWHQKNQVSFFCTNWVQNSLVNLTFSLTRKEMHIRITHIYTHKHT